MTAKKYKRPARRVPLVRGVSLVPMPPLTEEIRAIVREEVRLALGVILDAVRRTQPGQGGLHQAWIDAVLDENTSIHCVFFGRRKSVAEEVTDTWHSCDVERPPRDIPLEIGYGVDGQFAGTAYATCRGDGCWYSCLGVKLRDDLQRPSVWRRPVHQEQRAA